MFFRCRSKVMLLLALLCQGNILYRWRSICEKISATKSLSTDKIIQIDPLIFYSRCALLIFHSSLDPIRRDYFDLEGKILTRIMRCFKGQIEAHFLLVTSPKSPFKIRQYEQGIFLNAVIIQNLGPC